MVLFDYAVTALILYFPTYYLLQERAWKVLGLFLEEVVIKGQCENGPHKLQPYRTPRSSSYRNHVLTYLLYVHLWSFMYSNVYIMYKSPRLQIQQEWKKSAANLVKLWVSSITKPVRLEILQFLWCFHSMLHSMDLRPFYIQYVYTLNLPKQQDQESLKYDVPSGTLQDFIRSSTPSWQRALEQCSAKRWEDFKAVMLENKECQLGSYDSYMEW